MKSGHVKVLSLLVVALALASFIPSSMAQTSDYTQTFLVQNKPDGDQTYKLTINIPSSLYNYYAPKGGLIYSEADYSKFVTPDTLKPIADQLWQICNSSEDFANAVLMLVHQINYREIVPSEYPVQTLADGTGDCDLFATIAASILEAGGINTVLIYYKDKLHMEVGVQLPQPPINGRVNIVNVTYQNTSYYIGECTGGQWRTGWRVGECPKQYEGIAALVISVPSHEQTVVGQVSATITPLDASTLSLQVSTGLLLEGGQVTLSGHILPDAANENVTLKAQINSVWVDIATVVTQTDGSFNYNWIPPTEVSMAIQASWVGNNELNGAKSSTANISVLPLYFVLIIFASIISVLALVAAALFYSKRRRHNIDISAMPPPPIEPPASP